MSNKYLFRGFLALTAIAGMTMVRVPHGKTDEPTPVAVREDLEILASAEQIKDVALRGSAVAIWDTLEHGEKVECLDCISYIKPLLFDKDAQVREIAAWWLRKRLFGYAEVALEMRKVVAEDADPARRAAAANALGEFMDGGGTKLLVAAMGDKDASVRRAAVIAVARINDPAGAVAVSSGLGDSDLGVRKAALDMSIRMAGFADVAAVAKLLSDTDGSVRAKAADALGVFKAKGSSAGLAVIAVKDSDEDARIAATNAMGELADSASRPTLEQIEKTDPSSRVRDAARIAALKLPLGT